MTEASQPAIAPRDKTRDTITIHCSFCGRNQHEVRQMISANDTTFVCNECVVSCMNIVAQHSFASFRDVIFDITDSFACSGLPDDAGEKGKDVLAKLKDIVGILEPDNLEFIRAREDRNNPS